MRGVLNGFLYHKTNKKALTVLFSVASCVSPYTSFVL